MSERIQRYEYIGSVVSLQRLREMVSYHPYKMQSMQAPEPRDYNSRLPYCQALLLRLIGTYERMNSLWVSDEAHFHLGDFILN